METKLLSEIKEMEDEDKSLHQVLRCQDRRMRTGYVICVNSLNVRKAAILLLK